MPIHYKEKKGKVLSAIDAALTILEKLPKLESTNSSLSLNASANPVQFITDLLKTTAGYDKIVDIISSFISTQIPILEIGVKTVLIANMKNLISCSLNFFISDEIIKNGISFDAKTIDLMNVLMYSPLEVNKPFNNLSQKIGKYYYFDIEDVEVPDDLLKTKDFNAFLWYIINKSNKREVWNKKDNSTRLDINEKDKKSDGTITLEYHERSNSMTNIDGKQGVYTQTPLYNCIHVFLGNAEPFNISEVNELQNKISENYSKINNLKLNNENLFSSLSQIDKDYDALYSNLNNGKITEEEFNTSLNELDTKHNTINDNLLNNNNEINSLQNKIIDIRNRIKSTNFIYKDYTRNYYKGRTIIEFNYDYIMSLKLFDSKTLTAQLLNALTGCLSIDLSLSYEQLLVKFETEKIINDIVNTDHANISDCFFIFSNDDYNKMLSKAEKYRTKQLSINGEDNSNVKVNADDILKGLNSINKNTTKEEINTIIKDTIMNVSGMLSKEDYLYTDNVNFGVQMNIIENLLNELAYVITINILSPKIYLLLAINLQLMENKTDFSINGFIEMFKQFIIEIIREVRDILLKYLVDELMKIIDSIAKEIAIKLTLEQAEYYYRLINRLIECFKKRDTLIDFNVDNVNYADILSSISKEPENDIC